MKPYALLSRGARAVLRYLQACAKGILGVIIPKQQTIAARLAAGLSSVQRWVKELREAGWIRVQKRGRSSAQYFISREVLQTTSEGAIRGLNEGLNGSGPYMNRINQETEDSTVAVRKRLRDERPSSSYEKQKENQEEKTIAAKQYCGECQEGWKVIERDGLLGAIRCSTCNPEKPKAPAAPPKPVCARCNGNKWLTVERNGFLGAVKCPDCNPERQQPRPTYVSRYCGECESGILYDEENFEKRRCPCIYRRRATA